jgi:hypothetical protein
LQTDSFVDENSNPLEADPGLGHRPDGGGRDRMVDRDAISGAHRLTRARPIRCAAKCRAPLSSANRTIIKRLTLGIVACIDDGRETLTLHAFGLNKGKQERRDRCFRCAPPAKTRMAPRSSKMNYLSNGKPPAAITADAAQTSTADAMRLRIASVRATSGLLIRKRRNERVNAPDDLVARRLVVVDA